MSGAGQVGFFSYQVVYNAPAMGWWWHFQKTRFAEFMVWLGIDWPKMDDGDKLNAVIGLGLGGVGLLLTTVGVAVAVMEYVSWRQQQARRADLRAECWGRSIGHVDVNTYRASYALDIANRGDRSITDVSWRILVRAHRYGVRIEPGLGHVDVVEGEMPDDDGCPMVQVAGRYPASVNQGQRVPWLRIEADHRRTLLPEEQLQYCEYELFCSDGRFPATGLGKLPLSTRITVQLPE